MSLPRRSRFHSFAPALPSRAANDCPILAVGSRAIVTCADQAARSVSLIDADGITIVGTLAVGVEVEILAWRPQRAGGTRYRVVPVKSGIEGWVGAASLKPGERAPAARVVRPSRVPAAPAASPPRKSPRERRPPAPAKAVKRPARGAGKGTR